MIIYKTILVGVNFTEASRKALLQADMIAKGEGAELHVVHCVDNQGIDKLRKYHPIDISVTIQNTFKKLICYTEEILGENHSAKCNVIEGEPYQAMLQYGNSLDLDLLVIGSNEYEEQHSKSGIFSLKCMRGSRYPVLLVKDHDVEHHKKVIAFIDLSDVSVSVIEYAAKLTLYEGGDIEVVHFSRPPYITYENDDYKAQYSEIIREEMQATIQQATEYLPINIKPVVIEGQNLNYLMLDYLIDNEANIVAIGKTGSGSKHLRENPLGSTAELIARQANCSVLTIPHHFSPNKKIHLAQS